MTTRYLEINSAYRRRKDDPEVAEFVVLFGTTLENGYNSLYLPSFPVYTFVPNAIGASTTFESPYNTVSPNVDPNPLNTYYGLYNGYMVEDTSLPFPTNVTSQCQVQSYDKQRNQFTFYQALLNTAAPGDTFVVFDPSPYADTFVYSPMTPAPEPRFFNLQGIDIYYRRPALQTAFYVGYFLNNDKAPWGTIDARRIINFNTELDQVEVESQFTHVSNTPPLANEQLSIRRTLPTLRGEQIISVSADRKSVVLDGYASSTNDDYKNQYLYIYPSTTDSAYPIVDENKETFAMYVYRVVAYDGATRTAVLESAIHDGVGDGATPIAVAGGVRPYEILGSPLDYWSPLLYSGSTVSQSEPQCCEVELVNLVLPNVPLVTGSVIAFYPYVYVELRAVSASKTVGKDILYSNNPNAHSAMFICPITDIIDPIDSPFIKIDAFGMTQSIKFRPNDSFYFRVFLPDGNLFQPIQADDMPPLPANPSLQIEAIFAFYTTPV